MRCHLEALIKAKGIDFSLPGMMRHHFGVLAIRKQAVTSGTCPATGCLVGKGAEVSSPNKVMVFSLAAE